MECLLAFRKGEFLSTALAMSGMLIGAGASTFLAIRWTHIHLFSESQVSEKRERLRGMEESLPSNCGQILRSQARARIVCIHL